MDSETRKQFTERSAQKAPRPPGLHHTPPVSPQPGARSDGMVGKVELLDKMDAEGLGVPSFIEEGLDIIDGSRHSEYGAAEDSFRTIAAMWTAYWNARGNPEAFAKEDVAAMMRLMKEARLANSPGHRDSFVDVIGYLAIEARMRGIDK